jgi:glycosyltransferase involved in cell wall biosynthesis
MRVAYYSPLPPERSGIADYSALLLPTLARKVDVRVARRRRLRPPRVDVSLYHVGNHPDAHGWIVDALRRRPGPVVLHDFVLHHLVAGLTVGRGDSEAYRAAMFRDSGVLGRLLAHGVIDGLVPPLWETRAEQFPLTREILFHARGLLVHSRYVEESVRVLGYMGPIWRVPHPAWPRPEQLPDPGLPAGRWPVIGCFGNLTASKRIPQLARAFALLREEFPEALLLVVGEPAPGFELESTLERHGLTGDHVLRLAYVPEDRLWALMGAADISVNLRWPTMGETSGTAIRALALGRPLVVSDVGWFSELPDDTVEKVPVGSDEIETLADALARLSRDAGLRVELGAAGERWIRREHDLGRVADAYVAALEEAAGRDLVRAEVLGEVARAASEIGLRARDSEVAVLGEALSDAGLRDCARAASGPTRQAFS